MLPTGDTTGYDAAEWAHNQAKYIGGSHLLMLLVLARHAFHRADNPENAPVGQVMYGYSSIQALSDWTGLGNSTVRGTLLDLQAEFGYLIQRPRSQAGRHGRMPRVIRLFWTAEHDSMRRAAREGLAPLPDPFSITARQTEIRDRVPKLRLLNEVEQLEP